MLHDLLSASDNIGMTWLRLAPDYPLVGRTLAEANLRAKTGAPVLAIMRGRELIANPDPRAMLRADDRIGLVGDWRQLHIVRDVLIAPQADAG